MHTQLPSDLYSSSGAAYGPHVLLIDDDLEELRPLVDALSRRNFRVSVARDGLQGYGRATVGMPDLVLLEAGMAGMNSLAVCRRLKANPRTAAIPVIFLSSNSELEHRLAGLSTGAVDYIVKPCAPEEVIARIDIHLELARGYRRDDLSEAVQNLSDAEVLVRSTQRYLSDRLRDTPAADVLARALGTTEKRLVRAFRECLGLTVFEYVRHERMRMAKRLLAQTSLRVASIADEMGFSSAANFSTAFREHAGVSPSVFRKNSSLSHLPAAARPGPQPDAQGEEQGDSAEMAQA